MLVKIDKVCHCVNKNRLEPFYDTDSEEEAKEKATQILNTMKTKSCKTHTFFMKNTKDGILIDSKFNEDCEMF